MVCKQGIEEEMFILGDQIGPKRMRESRNCWGRTVTRSMAGQVLRASRNNCERALCLQ